MLPWVICALLTVLVIILITKIMLMKESVDVLDEGMAMRLAEDTNTLISIPSRDKSMMRLAGKVNHHLSALHSERLRLQNGDLELKEAVTNVSHDLRTPLAAIIGYLELLEVEDDPEKAKQYIGIIRNRAEALKQLTEEQMCIRDRLK